MTTIAWFFAALALIFPLDLWAYANAKYPERKRWYFKLIGGGIAAWLLLGPDEDDE